MILDKCSYISAIEEILNSKSKLSKLYILAGEEINHIVSLEKGITSELKLLKDKEIIDKLTYKSIKPAGSGTGILYRLGKIHKKTYNGLLSFHYGRCSFELFQLIPLPYSRGRSTRYSDRLHDFFIFFIIPRCYKDICVSSFFLQKAGFWNSLSVECFPVKASLLNFCV